MRFGLSSTGGTPPRFRTKVIGIYSFLAAFNIGAWSWAVAALHDNPVLLGAALAVYGLGLRHALDADHIAAIDNVTRRLMQSGSRPVAVGLFFALGHSTIVIAATAAIASSTVALDHIARFHETGAWLSTSISAGFLLLVGSMNLLIFGSICTAIYATPKSDENINAAPAAVGLLTRVLAPLLRLIDRSWLMFPLGFLFALGFDTAAEIALFGVSAAHAADGLPLGSILVFPVLFAAGMSLVDTTDGVMMVGAYNWALLNPRRKQYYNLAITALSVAVAFFIAGLEIASLFKMHLPAEGRIKPVIEAMANNMNTLGIVIVSLFGACWLLSVAATRLNKQYRPSRR